MMNRLPFRAVAILGLAVRLLTFAQPAHAEKRVALVIGNNDYKKSGDFRETGFLDTLDPRTRKRMPNPPVNA